MEEGPPRVSSPSWARRRLLSQKFALLLSLVYKKMVTPRGSCSAAPRLRAAGHSLAVQQGGGRVVTWLLTGET